MLQDENWMRHALKLAQQGIYTAKPNPAVGCVIVLDDQLVGEGWHKKAGEPHAEVLALRQAGIKAQGATAYVTLEPCSHFGKTPPCANALVEAGVKRVVVAMLDPNPQVAGRGVKRLEEAGIEVKVGLLQEQAELLNEGFIKRMNTQRPFVRVKLASSVDGRTAMSSGDSIWITDEPARQSVHLMRARHGAIVTGIGTILADDPQMNVRLPDDVLKEHNLSEADLNPIRVVLDPNLSMPLDSRMMKTGGRTILMTTAAGVKYNRSSADELIAAGAEIIAIQEQDGNISLDAVLQFLAQEENINEVMVEAGAHVAGGFFEAGLVDELHWYIGPHLMGHQGKPLVMLPSLKSMQDRIELSTKSINQVGDDFYFIFGVKRPKA